MSEEYIDVYQASDGKWYAVYRLPMFGFGDSRQDAIKDLNMEVSILTEHIGQELSNGNEKK